MSDSADRAQERLEHFEQMNITSVRDAERLRAVGHCLYCSEPLKGEQRFCDADCRDDFEREQQRKARG